MTLTPQQIRQLVEIAFTIEPLLDKKDCSTRFVDLPGKSIYNFVVSGINAGSAYEQFAKNVIQNESTPVFSNFVAALSNSNNYKENKFNNIGLLEFMFIVVKARIISNSIDQSLDTISSVIQNSTPLDVTELLKAHNLAQTTSKNKDKIAIWKNIHSKYAESTTLLEFYECIHSEFNDISTSHYQVSTQYLHSFPLINLYISEIDENIGIIKSLENTYNRIHDEKPEMKIGILADFCAAAMFLYLSFQNPDEYEIR